MAAIWVLKSHILPYKLIELSDFGDFCVVSYDLDLDEANGAKIITIKIMCDNIFHMFLWDIDFFPFKCLIQGQLLGQRSNSRSFSSKTSRIGMPSLISKPYFVMSSTGGAFWSAV